MPVKIKYKKGGVFMPTDDLFIDIGAALFKIEEDGNKLKIIKLYPEKPIKVVNSSDSTNIINIC